MNNFQAKRFILTGMPGSGKTSIINGLSQCGYQVIHEAATDIISKEQKGGNFEPWKYTDFIDKILILQRKRQLESEMSSALTQFYDRSPICTHALAIYLGFEPSDNLMREIDRIQKIKLMNIEFFFENLGFIKNTDARKITFDEALKFEQIHVSSYLKFGYECFRVPALSIDERVKFILNFWKKKYV